MPIPVSVYRAAPKTIEATSFNCPHSKRLKQFALFWHTSRCFVLTSEHIILTIKFNSEWFQLPPIDKVDNPGFHLENQAMPTKYLYQFARFWHTSTPCCCINMSVIFTSINTNHTKWRHLVKDNNSFFYRAM